MNNAAPSIARRFIVRRYMPGQAAPSLSLAYTVEPGGVERDALIAHLREFPYRDGARYEVVRTGERFGRFFEPGRVAPNCSDMNLRGYAPDRRRPRRVR